MLECLLISPDSSRENYQALASEYAAIESPVWAQLIAGTLDMFSMEILDPLAERLTDEQAIDRIWELKPKLICFVVYGQNPNSGTCNMAGVARLATKIRRVMSTPIAIVGPHASALPDETLALDYIDYVLPGDGVQALAELMDIGAKPKQVMWRKPYPAESFRYKRLPDYSRYRCHTWHNNFGPDRSPFAAIYTSIGCPFKCDFCMINMVNRSDASQLDAAQASGIRYFNTDMILDELEYLAGIGVKNVRISDEMFFLNRRHYGPILNGIISRGISLNLWAYARVDTVRTADLRLFQRAGVNWLCLGIEAGNQTVRREVTKGSFEDVDVRQVCREIKDAGINVLANFIFGLPDDNLDSMLETYELAKEINAEHTNYYPCMALPGSPLYRKAAAEGVTLPDTWSGYSFHSYDALPLPTKHLSAKEVIAFRDSAWLSTTLNPDYLALVTAKFGPDRAAAIVEQAKLPLKRKLLES